MSLFNKSYEFLYLLMILSLTYTACCSIPLLNHPLLFIVLGFILPFFISSCFFTTSIFTWMAVYLVIVLFNSFFGDAYFNGMMSFVFEAAYIYIPVTLFYYVSHNLKIEFGNKVVVLFFLIILLTTIATGIISRAYPSIIRHMNNYAEGEGRDFYDSLYRYGLMTYSLPHALPCLIPVIVLGLKRKASSWIYKFALILVLFSLFLVAYYSGSFVCMVMSIGMLIVSWIINPKSKSRNVFRIVAVAILLLVIFLTPSIRSSIIDAFLDGVNPESDFYEKGLEMKQIDEIGDVSSVEGDVSVRNTLYLQSLNAGLSSIIWGSDGTNLGNHSSFLDRFGTLGLVGILPFLFLLFSVFSYTRAKIPIPFRAYYWTGVIATLIIYILKSTNSWEVWFVLFFVLPVTLQLVLRITSEKSH